MSISSVTLHTEEEPLVFFDEYVQLENEFNPEIISLYSDDALIHAYRVYPHGLERSMQLSGTQWKQLLTRIMPLAKAQNDKSNYSNITATEIIGGYRIRADRYSVRKCYTDTGYYIVVKSSESGNLKIHEEYMETQPLPNC